MADTPAVTTESAPVPTTPGQEGYSEYLSLKAQSQSAVAPVEDAEETEPESAPGDTEESPELTDAEKEKLARSERDRQRTNRRLGQFKGRAERAESRIAELERQLAEMRGKAESRPATPQGKPKYADYVSQIGEGKRFKTFEDAQEAYDDAREEYAAKSLREQLHQEQQQHQSKADKAKIQREFQKSIDKYAKTHDDFDDSFESIADLMEQDAPHIGDAIVRCEYPGEVIDYLAKHPEEMDRLMDMRPDRARLRIGAIAAKFEKTDEPTKETPPKETPLPRSPRNLAGRGESPNSLLVQKKASESNDFLAWQAASTNPKTKERLARR